MIGTIRHHFEVGLAFLRFSIQRQIEYPAFLVSWFLLIPIQYFAGLWMLKVLTQRFETIGGWSYPELAFLYGVGLLSHAFVVITFMQTWNIEDFIIRGRFDRLMVRPVNVLFQLLFSNINLIGFIDLIPAVITFLHACQLLGFQWRPDLIFRLTAVVLGATLIRAAIYLTLGSVAFWTQKSRPLLMGGLVMMERTTNYPQTIFPQMIQVFLTFLLPIGFIAFYPVAEFLEKDRPFSFIHSCWLWTVVTGLAVFAIACLFFRVGLRKYEGSGS